MLSEVKILHIAGQISSRVISLSMQMGSNNLTKITFWEKKIHSRETRRQWLVHLQVIIMLYSTTRKKDKRPEILRVSEIVSKLVSCISSKFDLEFADTWKHFDFGNIPDNLETFRKLESRNISFETQITTQPSLLDL